MRSVRLCAIIAIGVAFGYAFDDATKTGATEALANSSQLVSSLLSMN
jgi:hypothetical protein